MNDNFRNRIICIAEDRKSCEPALKLLLTSLSRTNSHVPIAVFYPPADREFKDWVDTLNFENISLRTSSPAGSYSWNVKPQGLLKLLYEDHYEVVWIDSDILVTKNIFVAIGKLSTNILVVTEEALLGQNEKNASRARSWGFVVKRKFPFPLNSGVMRVTREHIRLLIRWKEILESPTYQDAQRLPLCDRPQHMWGDQDVLTALLSSEEFYDVPVKILRRGHDIVQYYEQYGFTLAERIACMINGMPVFIHQQGWKPWLVSPDEKLKGVRGKIVAAYQDLSPYTIAAIGLGSTTLYSWTRPRSKLSSILRTLGLGYPPLVGLPIAVIFDLERLAKLPQKIAKKVISVLCPNAVAALRTRRAAQKSSDR